MCVPSGSLVITRPNGGFCFKTPGMLALPPDTKTIFALPDRCPFRRRGAFSNRSVTRRLPLAGFTSPRSISMKALALCAFLLAACSGAFAAEPVVIDLWPGKPPGETKELPPEADQTKPEDRLIAGRRIIKLGNVSTPQLAVYRPAKNVDTGAAVVICPGGGHNILAYDLEGTEVAEWLN